jgi:hypothetical protein
MRTFIPTLMCLALSTALAQSNTSPSADTLVGKLALFSGTHLAFSDCQARMADMERMLGASGYGSRRTRAWSDGSVYASWYSPARHVTVMAVATPNGSDQDYGLSAYSLDGQVRWTDYLPLP